MFILQNKILYMLVNVCVLIALKFMRYQYKSSFDGYDIRYNKIKINAGQEYDTIKKNILSFWYSLDIKSDNIIFLYKIILYLCVF